MKGSNVLTVVISGIVIIVTAIYVAHIHSSNKLSDISTTTPASIYFNNPESNSNTSDAVSTTSEPTSINTSEPLVLLSQNDGEIYMTGSTTEIVWSGGNIKDPIRIYLESYQKTVLSIQGVISTTTIPLDGKLAWKVGDIYDKEMGEKLPFEAQLSSYIIRIEDLKTGDFVRSRVPFTIIDSN